jgi:hypothetical protein
MKDQSDPSGGSGTAANTPGLSRWGGVVVVLLLFVALTGVVAAVVYRMPGGFMGLVLAGILPAGWVIGDRVGRVFG